LSVLFDTNILIDCVNGIPAAQMELKRHGDALISIVTWIEAMSGARTTAESDIMRGFLARFDCLYLDAEIAEEAAILRQRYKLKLADALILATALVQNAVLVTRDSEFPKNIATIRTPYML